MGEMENLARVWFIAFASLLYVYAVVARLPKNAPRLMASLPIAYLFLKLPWLRSTVFLRTASAFFLVWLCSFRLALFCFDSGPLAENRDSLIRFLVFGGLPVKVKQRAGGSTNKLQQQQPHLLLSLANLAIEALVMILCLRVYGYKEVLQHPGIVLELDWIRP